MFKFAFDLARSEGFGQYVVWAKPTIEPIYRYLLFEVLDGSDFRHPELGNELHRVLLLDLKEIRHRYHKARHPFSSLLSRKVGYPS